MKTWFLFVVSMMIFAVLFSFFYHQVSADMTMGGFPTLIALGIPVSLVFLSGKRLIGMGNEESAVVLIGVGGTGTLCTIATMIASNQETLSLMLMVSIFLLSAGLGKLREKNPI